MLNLLGGCIYKIYIFTPTQKIQNLQYLYDICLLNCPGETSRIEDHVKVHTIPSFRCSVHMTIYVCAFVSHLKVDWQHHRSSWISCIKRHEGPTYIPFSCNVRWDRMRLNAPNFYSRYLYFYICSFKTTPKRCGFPVAFGVLNININSYHDIDIVFL